MASWQLSFVSIIRKKNITGFGHRVLQQLLWNCRYFCQPITCNTYILIPTYLHMQRVIPCIPAIPAVIELWLKTFFHQTHVFRFCICQRQLHFYSPAIVFQALTKGTLQQNTSYQVLFEHSPVCYPPRLENTFLYNCCPLYC